MIITFVFIVGLALGSFVNALVWRVRELERVKSKSKRKALSPLTGRSMCPACKHELGAVDLVPVISWLSLRGRCRYCKKNISLQYPLVELIGGCLAVVSLIYWPFVLTGLGWVLFGIWLGIITLLLALMVYDLKWMELPDGLVAWVSALGVVFVILQIIINGEELTFLLGPVTGAGLLFGLFYALFQVSGGRWIGGGDVKLAPVLGLLAGTPAKTLLLLFTASLIGSVIGVPLMLRAKNKQSIKLPFGPLLIIGLLIVFFVGQEFVDWYRINLLYL